MAFPQYGSCTYRIDTTCGYPNVNVTLYDSPSYNDFIFHYFYSSDFYPKYHALSDLNETTPPTVLSGVATERSSNQSSRESSMRVISNGLNNRVVPHTFAGECLEE